MFVAVKMIVLTFVKTTIALATIVTTSIWPKKTLVRQNCHTSKIIRITVKII